MSYTSIARKSTYIQTHGAVAILRALHESTYDEQTVNRQHTAVPTCSVLPPGQGTPHTAIQCMSE